MIKMNVKNPSSFTILEHTYGTDILIGKKKPTKVKELENQICECLLTLCLHWHILKTWLATNYIIFITDGLCSFQIYDKFTMSLTQLDAMFCVH